jgi:hypothetical protein
MATRLFDLESVDVVYENLFPNSRLPAVGAMSLDALTVLRKTNEDFLPTNVFVRPEMLFMWNLMDKHELDPL